MDMEWLLGLVRVPGRSLLNWHIRICSDKAHFLPDNSPFDFVGTFLVNDDVELQEHKELTQFFREDCGEILGFPTLGEGFAEAKDGFIAPPRYLGRSTSAFAGSEFTQRWHLRYSPTHHFTQ